MKKIPFVKYTSYGNNFVIVDEVEKPVLTEQEKRDFAYRATDICFGVGSDNLLIIQACNDVTLQDIHSKTDYWSTPPSAEGIDFIFRMFEPDGSEALCCGNGLMCIASYLNHRYGIQQATIMTEVPLAAPNCLTIGADPDAGTHWANMGEPRELPSGLIDHAAVLPTAGYVSHRIEELSVEFRSHDLSPISDQRSLSLSGYAVFTGEPHLVVMIEGGLSLAELGESFFVSRDDPIGQPEKRANFGTWLIDHIGNYVNKHRTDLFPAGVSINFVAVDQNSGEVMYRCFERGINHETLACGTGALAVAYVVKQLQLSQRQSVTIQPHRCNWFQPGARIVVHQTDQGWTLNGQPQRLLEGVFSYPPPTGLIEPDCRHEDQQPFTPLRAAS